MSIDIHGAKILFSFGGIIITETVVNTWIIMALITGVCVFLTRNMKVRATTKRQVIAEFLVKTVNKLVKGNMGERFSPYAPLIAAVLSLSAVSSMSSMTGIYAPTGDLSTLVGWALFVFALITYYKFKNMGFLGYFKSYAEPIAVMLPINVISEIATPVSMSFRHFGNIASGSVITALIYGALSALSAAILGLIPGVAGELLSQIPIFQIGLPAILSIYFDVFTSCIQAFIFSMLTMVYVSSAAN